jgi:hypothetical protein
MDKLVGCVARHAKRYRALLDEQWEQTEWTRGEADYVLRRLDQVLTQLPTARHQARERILRGQLVPSKGKILSLYEPDAQVIVRHKPGAEVEFGNTLLLGESAQGVIIDWELFKEIALTMPGQFRAASNVPNRTFRSGSERSGAIAASTAKVTSSGSKNKRSIMPSVRVHPNYSNKGRDPGNSPACSDGDLNAKDALGL